MSSKDKDRIIQRIKKCLALSESDSEHEAANALRQAQRMMEKHGIDIEEAKRPEFTDLRGKPRTFSAGMDSVAGASLPLRLLKPVLA